MRADPSPPGDGGTRLTLDLWHPNCWACESTAEVSGGVLAHAIYDAPMPESSVGSSMGLFTAYGNTVDEVETLLDVIESSPHTGRIRQLQERFDAQSRARAPGNVVREFFLEYDPRDMICPTLLSNGFVHSAPCRIESGRENWEVVYAGDRSEIEHSLDAVEDTANADIVVESITSLDDARSERERRMDGLTDRQRDVFEYARERGYYQWPRGVSTRELASELDLSKTTLLEHLRKAESKLLDPEH